MLNLQPKIIVPLISSAFLLVATCEASSPPLGTDESVKTQLRKQLHDNLQWYLTLRSMERVFEKKTAKEQKAFFRLFEQLKRPSLHGDGDIEAAMKRLDAQVKKVYGDKLKANPKLEIRGYDEFKAVWKQLLIEYRTFPSALTDIKIENIRVISVDPEAGKSVNKATLTFYDLKREVDYTVQDGDGQSGISCSLKPLPTRFETSGKKLKVHYPE